VREINRDAEMRRAFVRWVHKSFSRRGGMPVAEALNTALPEAFACE
jgi:hypothetical protein